MRLARRPHHGRRVGTYIYVPPQSAVTIIITITITIMSTLPFYLLELNLISAQDLAPVTKKKFRTYAVAWVNPERKLRTRIDQQGQTNPTWNDKFVFRVDNKFLNSDASAVNIEIYALGWLRDVSVGSVRVLITNLIPPAVRPPYNTSSTRRFVTLQIRRPSGRPQGILNMGVTLLDNTMRSMPLNTQVSAFGYKDLMEDIAATGGEEMERKQTRHPNKTKNVNATRKHAHARDEKPTQKSKPKPQLRRSNSDKTGLTSRGLTIKASSMVKGGSMVNGYSMANGGSMVNGFNGSMVNWGPPTINGGRGGSVLNDGGSIVISDVGPSASVVAAAVARGLYPLPGAGMRAAQQPGSSILGDWTIEDSSVEGLKTKIERWRMEVPAMYDRRDYQKVQVQMQKKTPRRPHKRSKSRSSPGLFSCFGNAYGCEFTIVCGANGSRKPKRCDSNSNLFSPSELGI
ncbi:hypothetical protein LguiA_034475 [Lonicera macranthoides]